MPKAQDLFGLVEAKKYSEALTMVVENPDFVNGVEESTTQSLVQSCIHDLKQGDASQAFIEHVVTHPQLNFSFKTEGGETNQVALVCSGRIDLIEKLLGKKEFLFIDMEPTYITAQKRLQSVSKSAIQTHARKNPGSPPLDPMTNPRVAQIAQIATKIKEATLKYAVEQDDADLIIKLQKADGNSAEYQAGGTVSLLITSLAKLGNVKINGWLAGTYPPAAPKLAVSEASAGAGRSSHTFYVSPAVLAKQAASSTASQELSDWELAENALKELEAKYQRERAKLQEKALSHDLAHLDEVNQHLGAIPIAPEDATYAKFNF